MLLWIYAFLNSYNHFVLSTAVCFWYFAADRDTYSTPISTGFKWGIGFHLGTLAFGSFILALIWLIKLILTILEKMEKNERKKEKKNAAALLAIQCALCLVRLFERCFKFVSRQAYIETAIFGTPFCKSTKQAFKIILSNIVNMTLVNGIVDWATLFALVFIAGFTTLISYGWLKMLFWISGNDYQLGPSLTVSLWFLTV